MKQVRALRAPLAVDLADAQFSTQLLWLKRDLGELAAIARSQLAYASLLDEAQLDRERARTLRTQALASAERIGMRGLTRAD